MTNHNIISNMNDVIKLMNEIFSLVLSIISFICIIGVVFVAKRSIRRMAEERPNTIFGYCARLKVYLYSIDFYIGNIERTPLYNLIPENYRKEQNIDSVANPEELVNLVKHFFEFLRNENMQIPLNMNFQKKLSLFLNELRIILILNKDFPLNSKKNVENVYNILKKYISELNQIIDEEQTKLIIDYDNSQLNLFEKVKAKLKK